LGEALASLIAVKSRAGEIVLRFIDGDFGLAHPVLCDVILFALLLFEHVLVGDGDGDLGFDLHVLIFHVEYHLLDHFFRIFGAIDGVVDVCAN
jgi:hypothetical protein